ncbi:MAG: anion permease [Candidatus Omnitrophica bacterium]|nr:anion permease [Candidatus Omnitrophota bacterium]
MSLLIIFFTLILGGYIGWTMGANDAANCVGADIGSGRMTVKQGIIITCIFSFLGAVFLGARVIKTIGRGIVPLDKLDSNLAILLALVSCFGAGTWILIATLRGLPVSTTHSSVGAVAGAGLAISAPIIWKKLLDIFLCWILTPIGSALLAYILYKPFRRLFFLVVPKRFYNPVVNFLIFFTSIYLAFTWGANDVANATGVINGAKIINPFQSAVFGAVCIILGIVTLGYRVIQTIGFKITRLLPLMTITAELASSLNVHIYTLFGIPVSTTHSIVGAVTGVGLAKGIRMINKKILLEIIFAWSLTPIVSGLVSFSTLKLISIFL